MKLNAITLSLGVMFTSTTFSTWADNYTFSAEELENTSQTDVSEINVGQFNTSSNLPGTYFVSITLNGHPAPKMEVKFVAGSDGSLLPALTRQQFHILQLQPVDVVRYTPDKADPASLESFFPGSSAHFDFNRQLLELNIPQIYMTKGPNDTFAIAPSQWDEGLNAVFLNYDVSGSQKKDRGEDISTGDRFVKLNSGVNLGPWRLRNQSTLDKPEEGTSSWNGKNTWAQRDIPSLAGDIYIGNRASDALLFDGFSFTGLALMTSQMMLSDQAKGYAPIITGIARTANARVQVSQNGSVIYQTYVPAGAFEIHDLYPQSGGGELHVSIKETNGTEQRFIQPWGTVPVMQRPGYFKYSLEAGRYNTAGQSHKPRFYQASLFYGLPHAMTLFGGSQIAVGYTSADIGYALSLGLPGAISVDLTLMKNQLVKGETTIGRNYRVQYVLNLPVTDTDISLSWASSPDSGYSSFATAVQNLDNDELSDNDTQKNKVQLTASQPIMGSGSLTLSVWKQTYWSHKQDKNMSFSYNQTWHDITFNLGWTWTQDMDGSTDQQLACDVQIPFSVFSSDTWISTGVNLQRPGTATQSLALNGNALDDRLSWSTGAINGDSDSRSFNAQLDYKARQGEYQLGYSDTAHNQALSYRAQSSILATPYGVVVGQPFDVQNAVALVKAPGTSGLQVSNNPGVITDGNGMTVVPYLMPYEDDAVALDMTNIDRDTTLENTEVHVIPTEGAVVLAPFTAHSGRKILFTLRKPDGTFIPFGATAVAGEQSNEGIVDDKGQVFLSGAPDEGSIAVKWGDIPNLCSSHYHLQPKKGKHLYELNLICS
ncbi:fimbria/pilus outer membrane usher protein [unidentified bacterial endosymbiont]|uniref:fimbria/pilus outer membrane usher protein n=1 Tax=unidentified bacterial endosymbiont TaxID=2355 RepID=UPI00209FCADE|nr:fimbria/pilus outer membrane usher protein [unidentified bacterial endosymbiont]